MTNEELITIVDDCLWRSHLRGEDLKKQVDNGAMFGSVYAQTCMRYPHTFKNRYREFDPAIVKRLEVALVRIRTEKIDALLSVK